MNTFLASLPFLLVFGSGIYAWIKCHRRPQYVEMVCYKNNSFVVSHETLEFLDNMENGVNSNFLYEASTSKYRSMLKQELIKAALDTPKSKKNIFLCYGDCPRQEDSGPHPETGQFESIAIRRH